MRCSPAEFLFVHPQLKSGRTKGRRHRRSRHRPPRQPVIPLQQTGSVTPLRSHEGVSEIYIYKYSCPVQLQTPPPLFSPRLLSYSLTGYLRKNTRANLIYKTLFLPAQPNSALSVAPPPTPPTSAPETLQFLFCTARHHHVRSSALCQAECKGSKTGRKSDSKSIMKYQKKEPKSHP